LCKEEEEEEEEEEDGAEGGQTRQTGNGTLSRHCFLIE
jgi:hypothetical protein